MGGGPKGKRTRFSQGLFFSPCTPCCVFSESVLKYPALHMTFDGDLGRTNWGRGHFIPPWLFWSPKPPNWFLHRIDTNYLCRWCGVLIETCSFSRMEKVWFHQKPSTKIFVGAFGNYSFLHMERLCHYGAWLALLWTIGSCQVPRMFVNDWKRKEIMLPLKRCGASGKSLWSHGKTRI